MEDHLREILGLASRFNIFQKIRLRFGRDISGNKLKDYPFVFIIGFNKTATRALHHLFLDHGVPSVHWDQNRLVRGMLNNLSKSRKILAGYDNRFRVFSDFILSEDGMLVEGNQFFMRLYNDYPNSYFILNTRDTASWLTSRSNHRDGELLNQSLKFYRTEDVNKINNLWATQKQIHETQVRVFLGVFPDRFVEVHIAQDDVIEKLNSVLPHKLEKSKWRVVGKSKNNTK